MRKINYKKEFKELLEKYKEHNAFMIRHITFLKELHSVDRGYWKRMTALILIAAITFVLIVLNAFFVNITIRFPVFILLMGNQLLWGLFTIPKMYPYPKT